MPASDLYRPVNTLSIDVACGAACNSYFFAKAFNVPVSWLALLVLSLSVWILYTTDHLLDAWKMGENANTDRHLFHVRHFRVLSTITCALIIADLILVWLLPGTMIRAGVILGLVAGVYFLLIQRIHWAKEFFAAALYTAGILVPVLADWSIPLQNSLPLIFQFYLAALLNLILFSWFDYDRDIRQGSFSFVTRVGRDATVVVLFVVFAIQTGLLVLSAFSIFFLLPWLIGCGHIIIYLRRDYLVRMDNFRLAGDALFLLPLVVVLLS